LGHDGGQHGHRNEEQDTRPVLEAGGKWKKLHRARRHHKQHDEGTAGHPNFLALRLDVICDQHVYASYPMPYDCTTGGGHA
jgi:hypothetical protein